MALLVMPSANFTSTSTSRGVNGSSGNSSDSGRIGYKRRNEFRIDDSKFMRSSQESGGQGIGRNRSATTERTPLPQATRAAASSGTIATTGIGVSGQPNPCPFAAPHPAVPHPPHKWQLHQPRITPHPFERQRQPGSESASIKTRPLRANGSGRRLRYESVPRLNCKSVTIET